MSTIIKTIKTGPLVWDRYIKQEVVYPELEDVSQDQLVFSQYNSQQFEVRFDNTTEIISVKFTNKTSGEILQNFSIDYNLIKTHRNYADQTYWAVSNTFLIPMEQGDKSTPSPVALEYLVDILPQTLSTRGNIHTGLTTNINIDLPQEAIGTVAPMNTSLCFVKIFVPYKNCPVSELEFLVQTPYNEKITVEFDAADGVNVTSVTTVYPAVIPNGSWKSLISGITVNAPANNIAGDNIIVNVTTENPNISEVYVEPIIGAVSRSRVVLVNGQGTFKIITSGLDAGDEVRVKLGYKFFSGVAEVVRILS